MVAGPIARGARCGVAVVLAALAARCGRPAPQPDGRGSAAPRADSIVLERTACYGTCPVYRLRVARTGEVVLTPGAVGRPGGEGTAPSAVRAGVDRVSADAFDRLVTFADTAGVLALPDSTRGDPALCALVRTDAPTVIVTVYLAAGPKRVTHYTGCRGSGAAGSDAPLRRLEAFADAIDREAGTTTSAPTR